MTEEKIIQEFLMQIKQDKSANTLRAYRNSCNDLLDYLSSSNKNLFFFTSQNEVDIYIEHLLFIGLNETTVKHRISVLCSLLAFSQKNGYMPDRDIHIKCSLKGTIEYADDEVVKTLYRYCTNYDGYDDYLSMRGKTEVLLVLLFGFKLNEIERLKVNDLKLSEKEISDNTIIRFIYDDRLIPIMKDYLKKRAFFLSELDSESDYLFINRFGKNVVGNTMSLDLDRICKEAGIKRTNFAALRNSCIRDYYKALPDTIIISKIFGIGENRVNYIKMNMER